MSGRLVVFVWRLVKTFRMFFVCVAFVACAWCHFEFRFFVGGSVHPSRRIRVGAALHLFLMMYPTFAGLS
jgi:hypothetical protein